MDDNTILSDPPKDDLSMDNGEPATESRSQPSFLPIVLSQLFGLGWLAPIIALLVLNFKGYIVGASIGCGVRKCDISPYDPDAARQSQRLDTNDHSILGALQLVAKALEMWFIFVAGSLVYDLTMLLARRASGLPFRYLSVHLEFAELRTLFERSFWTSADSRTNIAKPQGHVSGSRPNSKGALALYAFVLPVVAICILSNLMGPATAVLLIPTLGWRQIQFPQTRAFTHIASSDSPKSADQLSGCLSSQLATGDYSCTYDNYGPTLDVMLMSTSQYLLNDISDIASEGFITFSLNLTNTYNFNLPVLAPNRQALDELKEDYNEWEFSTDGENCTEAASSVPRGNDTLTESNCKSMQNSLQTLRQRQAPALSFSSQCYPNVSAIHLSENKIVRCFNIPNPDLLYSFDTGNLPYPISNAAGMMSTMCIRVGSGWPGANSHAKFTITASDTSSRVLLVNVYSSDRAIYLNASTFHCSANPTAKSESSCNWDALFSEEPHPANRNETINPQITEYSMPGYATIWCRSFTYLRFPIYLLDTSPVTNPITLALLQDDAKTNPFDTPISVHPDWTLAAWSVARNGVVSGGREGATTLLEWYQSLSYLWDDQVVFFGVLHNIATAQGLSLINYATQEVGSSPSALKVFASVRVWSYGLDSRTSKLGVVVALAGCVCVLVRTFVGLKARSVNRSIIELLTTALEQRPPGAFNALSEKDVGRVRVQIENKEEWKYLFGAEQRTT